MKKNLFVILSIFSFLFANQQVFAQKRKPATYKKKPPLEVAAKIDTTVSNQNFLGSFEGNIYTNKFFGIKITIPEDWVIAESEIGMEIKKKGSETIKGKTAEADKAYDQAMQRLTPLFTVSKDILGMSNNAIMIFSAEKKAPLTQIRNGKDYLRLNLDAFKRVQLPPDFKYSETIKEEKLGSEIFYSLDIQRNGYQQRFYATYRKGYSLFFTLSYLNNEDLEKLKQIIKDSDFAWKKIDKKT